MTRNQQLIIEMLSDMRGLTNRSALERFARLLDYELILNPVNPDSPWLLLEHPAFASNDQALMALRYDEELTLATTVPQLRKRYEEVEKQRMIFGPFAVYLYAFVGSERVVIYRAYGGNRDERLDISIDSIQRVSLYADALMSLKKDSLELREDVFGNLSIVNLDNLFKRELSTQFTSMVQLYKKRIAEVMVNDTECEDVLLKLVPKHVQVQLRELPLHEKVLNFHFKAAIGSIVDTIVLRVLLRRFFEAYHGLEPFSKQDDMHDLGFGQGEGKMEEVLRYLAEVKYRALVDEKKLDKALHASGVVQLKLFDDLTSEVIIKEADQIKEIYERMRKQFELAYGGDLFDSDVALIANQIENQINEKYPELLLGLWADTSSERYNFRYEDLPPEMIQEHYENSMSHSIKISVQKGKKATVEYSDDLQEQKHRGAYYTDNQLVSYMVEHTVGREFDKRRGRLEALVSSERSSQEEIIRALRDLQDIKVVDFTCGGGSFLRGVFRYLSSKRTDVVRTLEAVQDKDIQEAIEQRFPQFGTTEEAQGLWEKHILLEMVYGIDIDYKALIISTQTLTLSAMKNWQAGENFPKLIGLTLMHQNSLISPVSPIDREKVFGRYQKEIKELIDLRRAIIEADSPHESKSIYKELFEKRKVLQALVGESLRDILGKYQDAMLPEAVEINFPEVFFDEDGSLKDNAGFTVCLGNPPWEIWKPNSDEFFEEFVDGFRQLSNQEKLKKMDRVFQKMPYIKDRWEWLNGYYEVGSSYYLQEGHYKFQRTRVNGRFTGSDINLYKVSLERAYQVLADGGHCGLLVPSNVYTDQGSTGLRQMLFRHTQLTQIASFENRRGIFPAVDSRYKFAILLFEKGGMTEEFNAFFYRYDLQDLYEQDLFMTIPVETVKKLAPDTWSIMEFRDQREVDILSRLSNWPLLGERIPGKWNVEFIREFDMTNDSHHFQPVEKGKTLFEGKMMEQFTHLHGEPRYAVGRSGEKKLEEKEIRRIKSAAREHTGLPTAKAVRKLFGSQAALKKHVQLHSEYFRIAYRAIASSTNRRTLISTILPKHVYCGHSLNATMPFRWVLDDRVLKKEPNYSLRELLVIVSLLNSFVVDFILRRKTNSNISMFLLYQLPIPRLSEGEKYFTELMKRAAVLICTTPEFDELAQAAGITKGVTDPVLRQLIRNQIDAYVAAIYGVTREDFLYILSTFKSPKHKEEMEKIAQGVIEQFDILREKGELECPI